MKKLLTLTALLISGAAFAGEGLVLTTATKMTTTGLVGRKATEVQNLGPNPIFCQLRNGNGLAVNKGRKVDANGGSWAVDGIHDVWCISSANQVTGAATIVTELN